MVQCSAYMKQEEVINILKMGHSAYLTGEAGSGKTHVLNIYISWLKERGINPAVTASTGIAATHLGGSTIHSWSGIGIRDSVNPMVLDQMEQKRSLWKRFQETDILIIDEISMLSGAFLDMCDEVARHLKRAPEEPFGGMQVIFSGDFFQLPPVEKGDGDIDYAFKSKSWEKLCPVVCYLDEQHRQGDWTFLEILSAIRQKRITGKHQSLLNEKYGSYGESDGKYLRLFTHNRDVDRINEDHLNRIKSKEYSFQMSSKGNKNHVESLKRGCLAPEILRLKKGAEVMFVKNDHNGQYVNGTQGTITGFESDYPIVRIKSGRTVSADSTSWKREEDGKVLAEINQIPLRLAWAVTVHKSQGMTLDEAEMDLSQCFVSGQGYVALSRVKSLEGLYLRGLNSKALEVDESVAAADLGFRKRSEMAQKRLNQLSRKEIEERQKIFVNSIGGSWKTIIRVTEKESTLEKTRNLLSKGYTLEETAGKRDLSLTTIMSHAEKLITLGTDFDFSYLAPEPDLYALIEEAALEHGLDRLYPIKKYLENQGCRISYEKLRRVRLFMISLSKKTAQ